MMADPDPRFPWEVEMFLVEVDGNHWSDKVYAYHLEDLARAVQERVDGIGLFRIGLPSGNQPVELEAWAEMLSHNYQWGRPDREWEYGKVTIRNGTIIVDSSY